MYCTKNVKIQFYIYNSEQEKWSVVANKTLFREIQKVTQYLLIATKGDSQQISARIGIITEKLLWGQLTDPIRGLYQM